MKSRGEEEENTESQGNERQKKSRNVCITICHLPSVPQIPLRRSHQIGCPTDWKSPSKNFLLDSLSDYDNVTSKPPIRSNSFVVSKHHPIPK